MVIEVRYEDNGLRCEYHEMRGVDGRCSNPVIGSMAGWLLCDECMAIAKILDGLVPVKDE